MKQQVFQTSLSAEKKLRDFVSMLERNDVSPVHVEEMIDDFFYAG